jgi:hypothetical protein
VEGTCSLSLHQGSNLIVYVCHPAVLYMLTMFARYLVGPGISCGARKLIQTPWVTQKKKKSCCFASSITTIFGLLFFPSISFLSHTCILEYVESHHFFFYQHLILQCIKYISFLVLDNLFLSFPSCFMVKSNTYASVFRKFILLVIF